VQTIINPDGDFETSVVSLGDCRLPNLDDIAEVLAFGEGENFH
jgi:hypothetical protein